MLSNVKKKDVPLIVISLAAIVFIAATLSLFPQQTAQAANSIFNGVTRLLGSAVQVLVLLALGLVLYPPANTAISGSAKVKSNTVPSHGCLCLSAPVSAPPRCTGALPNGLITTRPRA